MEICDYLCYNLDEVKRKRGSSVRLKNILIVVNDIELSKEFYQELFGLRVVTDFGENVILSEGLVLQEKKIWEQVTGKSVTAGGNNVELYFEEYDLEAFAQKLNNSKFPIRYVNELMEPSLDHRVIRIYDPDEHIIEIGEQPLKKNSLEL